MLEQIGRQRYPGRLITRSMLVLVTLVAALCSIMLISAAASQASGVTVQDLEHGATAGSLAESLAGGGISISNVTYTGNRRAAGSFTAGMGSIGFERGVVLSSGKVETDPEDPACSLGVEGPNTCHEPEGDNSTAFGEPGDSQLTELAGVETHDASNLEFDFVPTHSTVTFSYVFSSEEYDDFTNSEFDDVFGFFVNGTNCALVPGTTEPVSVDTINDGPNGEGGEGAHHPELFRDNVHPAPSIETQMDGLTTVLSCTATVTSNQTNHLKLAIADGSDEALDSAVFIGAGSLVSGTQVTTSPSGGGQSGANVTAPPVTKAPGPGPGTGNSPPKLPPPVLGSTANVKPVSGTVLVKLPPGAHLSAAGPLQSAFESLSKGSGFIPLTEARQIPVGSTLDTTRGVVQLTTATASSSQFQEGNFGAGIFTILQQRQQRGLVNLNIVNTFSPHQVCASVGKQASVASKHLSSKVLGRLNGSAHGKYTTRGQYSAATVRGTIWGVTNRCDGTLTQVKRGVVAVQDFVRRKTITIRAGQQYLAKAP